MTVYLKKIELIGFRGALQPVTLEFKKGNDVSIVLYGENGFGKTTFTEALEWYYTDKIDYLEKEFCGKESYFNSNLGPNDNASVQIEFSNPDLKSTKTLRRRGPSLQENLSDNFSKYLTDSNKENFILRHHNLKEFVDDKSKTDKLEHFEKLIGMERVSEFRNIFLQSYNSLNNSAEYVKLNGRLEEVENYFNNDLGIKNINEINILKFSEARISKIIADFKLSKLEDINGAIVKLKTLGSASKSTIKKQTLESIIKNLENIHSLSSCLDRCIGWVTNYNLYIKDSKIIQQDSLFKLYEIGKSIISGEEWNDKELCPLCGNKIDSNQLIKHLSDEIQKLDSLSETKKELGNELKEIQTLLTSRLLTINSILNIFKKEPSDIPFIRTDKSEIMIILGILKDNFLAFDKLFYESFQKLNPINIDIKTIKDNTDELVTLFNFVSIDVNSEIKSIEVSQEIQNCFETASLLNSLLEKFISFNELKVQIETHKNIVNSLKLILKGFESVERKILEKIINDISQNIDLYYNILNPDEGINNISLFTTENVGAERGIEINYEFHGVEQFPARKYLSESHRNALGLSIFLSSARYFNKINKFLVLDDIYNSLDINHRERLITLFNHTSLSDLQFFITTHDIIWYKTMQRALLGNSRWKFMEIRKWQYDFGIEVSMFPETIRKRILDYIKDGDSFAAIKSVRSYYEETLKKIAKKLEIKVPYKEPALWEAGEFYSGIAQRLKDSRISDDIRFKSGQPTAFLANLLAHENDISVSSGTVNSLVTMIDEFEKAFKCPEDKCQTYVWYARRSNSKFQCKCSNLDC